MNEDLQLELDAAKESMEKAIKRLDVELTKVRAGKASPSMLSTVMVDYYGAATPLSQIANVNTPDAKTITVQPWERKMIDPVSKAIIDSNIGLNPQNNGEVIILSIPPLTEERRRDLCKQAKGIGEDAKVAIRGARKSANDGIKALKEEGLPEDMLKDAEGKVQEITNAYVAKIDAIVASKEKDIMTV